jgi:hypothetical protein
MAQKLKIDIVAKDRSKQALQGVRGGLDKVKGAVFNLQNAFIGLGVGLAVRSLVNTGKQIEGLQVRLKFLFGSAKEGGRAFDEMAKFAAKVPFSLEEIQAGSGVLAVVSEDAKEMAKLMQITGNVAAVTGLDFKTTAEQIQRSLSAGISAADLFRDRGVKDMLGFKAGAVVSVEETAAAFDRVFGKGGKFDGATDALAATFEGTLSMLGDSLFNFKREILDAGFFAELKNQFKLLDTFIKTNEQSFKELAQTIGSGLASAVRGTASAIVFLKENLSILFATFKFFVALKLILFFRNLATSIAFSKTAMLGFNKAVKKNLLIGGLALVISQLDFFIKKIKELAGIGSDEIENMLKPGLKLITIVDIFGREIKVVVKDLEHASNIIEISMLPPIFEVMTTWQKIKKAVAETVEKIRELTDKRLEELKKKTTDIKTIIAEGFIGGIKKMSNALAEAIVLGKSLQESFRRMAEQLLVKIIAYLIEEIVLLGIKKIFNKEELDHLEKKNDLMRKNTTEMKRQAFWNMLTGGSGFSGFASGGAVSSGKPVVVGERGPEMFVPNSSGQITQNARGVGGGSTTVNFNINTVDARGFDELLTQSRGTITQLINQAVNERGAKSII